MGGTVGPGSRNKPARRLPCCWCPAAAHPGAHANGAVSVSQLKAAPTVTDLAGRLHGINGPVDFSAARTSR